MMRDHSRLVKQAIILLDKFRLSKYNLEAFIEDAPKTLKDLEASEQTFVLDIISGCVEHKKLLDVVVNTFYNCEGKCLLQTDRNLFVVICFLATFMLEELGLHCFSKIVRSLDAAKMHKFLSFFFNATNLSTWIRGEWSEIYDASYVESTWIGPLQRWQPEVEVLIDQLTSKMDGRNNSRKHSQKYTVPKEFVLTKAKARTLHIPELIPQQERHCPVPTSTYRPPVEKEVLEKVKQKNRRQAQKVLLEASTQPFRCANPHKSERTKNVLSQIQEERQSQLQFNTVFSSGTPATHKADFLPIRLNTTAILREGALYNRQVEEELRKMEALLDGGGEPSSFLRWQSEMLKQDLQEELAKLERQHLEGLISHEEAALARVRVMECNQKRALLKKEEMTELMRRYAKKRMEEEKEMRELVEQVVEGHKNAKVAKVKLQEYKQRIVQEVSDQNRELMRQALEQAQAELSRRLDLIRQIRAMESVPYIRQKFVDDTETAGHALLGEMSLAELRERLALLREAQDRERQERQQRLQEERQSRKQWLLDQLDIIGLHRTALGEKAAQRQQQKKAQQELSAGVKEDQRLAELRHRLDEKRQERERHRQAAGPRGKASAQPQAPVSWISQKKPGFEEHQWGELESRLERQIKQEALRSVSQDMGLMWTQGSSRRSSLTQSGRTLS